MSDLPVSAVPIWGQYVQNPMTLSFGLEFRCPDRKYADDTG